MSKPMNRPDRDSVDRVCREEARRHGIGVASVLGWSRLPQAVAARRKAIKRLLDETGCSRRGLAAVWGLSDRTVNINAKAPDEVEHPYDNGTIQRLQWRYGPERTAQIMAGGDPRTSSDILKWRGFGRGAAR